MLRAGEIAKIVDKAQIDFALCDHRAMEELERAREMTGRLRGCVGYGNGELEQKMAAHSAPFTACDTACEDVALLAFTSGTTGEPKATMHFHRDILLMADIVGGGLLQMTAADIVCGSPPLGFTFGVGALLVFPLRHRAASLLIEKPTPDELLSGIYRHRATMLFTAPTAYHRLLPSVSRQAIGSLRMCISAGEPLPKSTSDAWHAATGLRIVDGIGTTEMIHIFISAVGEEIRPGATGKALPGYEACVLDSNGQQLPPGQIGRLAVKGPTGCRYLADRRQREYVQKGWNVTGDLYRVDEDGYYWFEARGDDLIVSAGYNIAAPEVEAALMQHPVVSECAVVGAPDSSRGTIVKAYVVLTQGTAAHPELIEELQRFVKSRIAPFKYPRVIEFLDELPKTQTGKVQRSVLRKRAASRAAGPDG
jgi:2-aminobenzoate-CoA ligase